MNAKRRGAPRSVPVRGPAWLAVLLVLAGAAGAGVVLSTVPAHLAESTALDRGPCDDDVPAPCAQVETGRVGEPEPGSRRTSTLRWPVETAGERVMVALSEDAEPPVTPGDEVEVWRYDGQPLALVADGQRFEVGLTGGAGLVALLTGALWLVAVAVAGAAQLLARTGRRPGLARGLHLTAMAGGGLLAIAIPIVLLVG